MVKDTLKEYKWLRVEIAYYERSIKVLRDLLLPLHCCVPGVEDLIKRYEKSLLLSESKARKTEAAVLLLTGVERDIIKLHFLDGHTWEATAEKVNYSYQQTLRIADKAINKIPGDYF